MCTYCKESSFLSLQSSSCASTSDTSDGLYSASPLMGLGFGETTGTGLGGSTFTFDEVQRPFFFGVEKALAGGMHGEAGGSHWMPVSVRQVSTLPSPT